MIKSIIAILILGCSFCAAFTQNLILNPSFELISLDTNKILRRGNAFNNDGYNHYGWNQIKGSIDFYYNVSNRFGGICSLQFSNTCPRSGSSLVGFLPNDESILGTLSDTLIKGEKYNLSFFIQLGSFDKYALKYLDIHFYSNSLFTQFISTKKNNLLEYSNDSCLGSIRFLIGNIFSSRTEWIEISAEYEAVGGEKYFLIGNKEKNIVRTKTKASPNTVYRKYHVKGYYLFDDFCLTNSKYPNCKYNLDSMNTRYDTTALNLPTIVFENLIFRSNSSELSSIAEQMVQQSIPFIKQYLLIDSCSLVVNGYTDNSGTENENLKLSFKRAIAVAQCLISNGIPSNRIKIKGLGSQNPIAPNDSEVGRLKNRRVEIQIVMPDTD